MTAAEIEDLVDTYLPVGKDGSRDDWELEELYRAALVLFPVPDHINPDAWDDEMSAEDIQLALTKGALEAYDTVEERLSPEIMRIAERQVMLRALDTMWVRHLTDLDMLREGISLMAIAQRDPLVEYKRESFAMWQELQSQIQRQIVQLIYRVELAPQQPPAPNAPPANGLLNGQPNTLNARNVRAALGAIGGNAPRPVQDSAPEPVRADAWDKVGRNDPCPCGSGKKFKNCHYPEIQRQRQTVAQEEVRKTVGKRRR